MKLPFLSAPDQSVEMVSQFGGLNRKLIASENEFSDMKNMTSIHFPMAATRGHRGKVLINGRDEAIGNPIAIHAKDKFLISYVQKGESGISFPESVAAADVKGIKQADGQWTSVIECNNPHEVSNLTYGMQKNSPYEEYKYLFYIDDTKVVPLEYHSHVSGTVPPYNVYVKWSHDAVPHTIFLYRILGRVSYIEYGTSSTYIKLVGNAVKDERLFAEEFDSSVRIGNSAEYVFSNSLDEDGNRWIHINSVVEGIKTGDAVYGKSNVMDNGFSLEAKTEADLYTEAKISAPDSSTATRLSGKSFECGDEKVYVESVKLDHDEYIIRITKPHGSIPQGFNVIEDRLFLGELNPQTGDMISTNICAAATGKRSAVEMGANLVFFPEKVMVNTAERSLSGEYTSIESLERHNTLYHDDDKGYLYEYILVDANGNIAETNGGEISANAPSNPQDGFIWFDTTRNPYIIRKWSAQTDSWAVLTPYVELSSPLLSREWEIGDAFCFVEKIGEGSSKYLNSEKDQKYYVISDVGEKDGVPFIRFPCSMTTGRNVHSTPGCKLTLMRTVPDMDFVVESENRLWGCKYGEVDGKMINEIFACKQGDPKNWHYFANTALDSYYVSLGSDGAFTGAVTYNGNPMFFREDCMHRVYGNYPANYSLKTYACHGVEKGSENSLAIMNDVLYYNAPSGVMAYAGSAPIKVSEALGMDKLKNVCSGAMNNNLYVSALVDGKRKLYVFNDYYKLWHIEDDIDVKSIAVYGNDIYVLTTDGYIFSLSGKNGEIEGVFDWSLESARIGFSSPFNKFIFKINARLLMSLGASASVSIQYDSSGDWEHISMISPKGKTGSITIPIKPRRCDHFALKFAGKGDCKILSLTKYMEEGSDIV